MNKRDISLLVVAFSFPVLFAFAQGNETKDTLYIPYTYWWPESGPFIGYCGNEYALVFLGIVREIALPDCDSTLMYIAQKGTIEIAKLLHTHELDKEKYIGQKYFSSDSFYQVPVQQGDTVAVFCYEYEGQYSIPGTRSIMKIDGFDDPVVQSIQKYIDSDQNANAIKDDVELWASKGFETEVKQILECEKSNK